MQKVAEHEYELLSKDRTNLWDQLCELIKIQKWTTQDLATTSLLREMNNVISLFIVRKSDNLLLGATILVETETLVLGNIYVMREGYRASGMGMQLVKAFQGILRESFKRKPLLARGVDAMLGKYSGLPFLSIHLHGMYSFQLKDRKEVINFFPAPATHEYTILAVRDMTPRQFQQLIDYDKMITGVDRTTFLQNYYSLSFVEGVVLYNKQGKIKGMAGIVPTPCEDHLYKLSPIYAENKEDAATLTHAISGRVNDPEAKYVFHIRTESAGDWILKKCHDENVKLHRVGVLACAMNMNQRYKDPSRTEFIFAPTNSPAHFDG